MSKELSKQAQEDMEFLGHFGPTVRGESFKGWMYDDECEGVSKAYLHESDFRNLAKSCLEVAEWIADTKGDTK